MDKTQCIYLQTFTMLFTDYSVEEFDLRTDTNLLVKIVDGVRFITLVSNEELKMVRYKYIHDPEADIAEYIELVKMHDELYNGQGFIGVSCNLIQLKENYFKALFKEYTVTHKEGMFNTQLTAIVGIVKFIAHYDEKLMEVM